MDDLKLSHPKTTILALIVVMFAGAFCAKLATKHLDAPTDSVDVVIREVALKKREFIDESLVITPVNASMPIAIDPSLDSDQYNKEIQEAATFLLSGWVPLPRFEEEQLSKEASEDSSNPLLATATVFDLESISFFRNVSFSRDDMEIIGGSNQLDLAPIGETIKIDIAPVMIFEEVPLEPAMVGVQETPTEEESVHQEIDENEDDEEIASIFQLIGEIVLSDLLNGGILGDSEEIVFMMGDEEEDDNEDNFVEKLVQSLGDPVPETGDELFDVADAPRQPECWIVCSPGSCFADAPMNWQLFQVVNNCWQSTNGEEFFIGNDPSIPTIIYIHGNLADMDSTIQAGNYLMNRFRLFAGDTPFRLVLWKWGSEKTLSGIRKDAQYKASLADADGRSMASFLERLTGNITLIGFSFGARNIGAALQQLACEGSNWNNDNTEQPMINPKYNVFFVGGATDESDFYQCGRFAQSVSLMNLFVNVYNPQDSVLRFYPHLYNFGGNKAIGVTHLYSTLLSPDFSGKAIAINCCNIGREHNFVKYMQSIPPSLLQVIVSP